MSTLTCYNELMKEVKTGQPPTVTVDNVCFAVVDGELNVLLLKRDREPFKNSWALPGGYVENQETTADAASRVLRDKAGVPLKELPFYEQLYTFDTIGGDPRGHAISVAYIGLSYGQEYAMNTQWISVHNLPELAFDHKTIINSGIKRLRSKLNYSNSAFALLDIEFTLTQLQSVYQSVTDNEIDKRNFRKKILSTGLIESIGKKTDGASHRPAGLYRFKQRSIQEIEQFILV